MRLGSVRGFALELARGPGGAYRGGEQLCGRVLLEVAAPLRVRALVVAARGGAATHWLERRSVGVNAVSRHCAAAETYLRRRQLLLRVYPAMSAALGSSHVGWGISDKREGLSKRWFDQQRIPLPPEGASAPQAARK
ncbi:Arrestin domain-containing protein 2 [Sciurus carolinensis]|uniref:Arrestin domain-containing protein 2 n=1 Tax=Sciurus carolinensis TaxID=30640 RepID=A0AA41MIB2_SCICA|nr:Arrestin domain-containing protein 2 [Sciurus carolinensis]